jgi:hypothetical protein
MLPGIQVRILFARVFVAGEQAIRRKVVRVFFGV